VWNNEIEQLLNSHWAKI